MVGEQGRGWHQALAYALTGERRTDLGRQDTPDLEPIGLRAVVFALVQGQLRQNLPDATVHPRLRGHGR